MATVSAGGGGPEVTVSTALLVTPPVEAEIVTLVLAVTALVVMVKLAVLAPVGIVMLCGTATFAGALDERVTVTPADGAAPDSVTAPVAVDPPCTLVGLSVRVETVGGGAAGPTVSAADFVLPPS